MARQKGAKDEDEKQSARFLELARELEDAGELNLTEAEQKFEKAMELVRTKQAAPPEDT